MTTIAPSTTIFTTTVTSPIGPLTLAGTTASSRRLRMEDQRHASGAGPGGSGTTTASTKSPSSSTPTSPATGQAFDVPIGLEGTPFQGRCGRRSAAIPFGETISYAELARRVGRAGAFRAVGQANGRNPVAIVVPCHRVVAADGTIGGYGGGLDRKRWLLTHEGASGRWSD